MINKILQSLFLLFLLGFLGCDYNKNKSREKPDVSAMKDEVKLMEFSFKFDLMLNQDEP